MMQHGKETEMPGKCRSVLCCLDEHLLRQIDGKFGSQFKRYYQTPPGGYLEALSPGLLLEVTCLKS